jgi:hypothetical protein
MRSARKKFGGNVVGVGELMRYGRVVFGIPSMLFCVAAFVLVACGGGGTPPTNTGGGGSTPTPTPTPTPSPTPLATGAAQVACAPVTPAPGGGTTVCGLVVNDANGSPKSGEQVRLMPWGTGPGMCSATPVPTTSITPENDGCPTPLPSPVASTGASGTFTLGNVPAGHYIVVIGAENDIAFTPPPGYAPPTCINACGTPTPAPFTVQAVIHDNVTIASQSSVQVLQAPTLPVATGITVPIWETNGDYRLATLDASTEMPCYIGWEYERTQHGLAGSAVDEWLTENERTDIAYLVAHDGGTVQTLTTGHGANSGGTDCVNSLVAPISGGGNAYASDPRTLWFGGQYAYYVPGSSSSAFGVAEFPIDPRSLQDPNITPWP